MITVNEQVEHRGAQRCWVICRQYQTETEENMKAYKKSEEEIKKLREELEEREKDLKLDQQMLRHFQLKKEAISRLGENVRSLKEK